MFGEIAHDFNYKVMAALNSNNSHHILQVLMFIFVIMLVTFPFYLKNQGEKLYKLPLLSFIISIMLYLVYIIYVYGGFNA